MSGINENRQVRAFNIRNRATVRSGQNNQYSGDNGQESNGDENRFSGSLLASFTKGLPHDCSTGLMCDVEDYKLFRRAIRSGNVDVIAKLPLGPSGPPNEKVFGSAMAQGAHVRGWENMAAGITFSLEGPDCQRLAMPPAPKIDSIELSYEMSELYWMAILRDVRFSNFMPGGENTEGGKIIATAIDALSKQEWATASPLNNSLTPAEKNRIPGEKTFANIFRGFTRGDDVGPYLSQFLLVGSEGRDGVFGKEDGFINYGSIRIDQRVQVATERRDYMTSWEAFIDVQNAADIAGRESYVSSGSPDPSFRFITTPRDLATYVHYDALYEAYLNACLIMLALEVPFDEGLPFTQPDRIDKQSGFALFGGAHILTLVTEVATRALKAARFQKFNIHRRPRPEAVAALIDGYSRQGDTNTFEGAAIISEKVDQEALMRIGQHNKSLNATATDNGTRRVCDYDPCHPNSDTETFLLPMAFPEGSPMHPSYGAGHATVAGACVTMLKAFFKHDHPLGFCYVPSDDGTKLESVEDGPVLTVEGELNKVCSNISIGRNWAGVHWSSDYIESIKIGEEIAIGILNEQMLTYRERFSMTLPKFDGTLTTITNIRNEDSSSDDD